MIVTTSWDDGHPADVRLGELLNKHGVKGTFYVPCRNSEGRPVMGVAEIRELAKAHEIGAHTLDHVDLTMLPPDEANRQIVGGKNWLEDVIGSPVHGFCYVRGKYNRIIRSQTIATGFAYARTVKSLCSGIGSDPFTMPTTLQFYPHGVVNNLKNLVKYGPDLGRIQLCLAAISTADLTEHTKALIDLCAARGGCFHLWGHSWEIEERNLWAELDEILDFLSRQTSDNTFATNYQVQSSLA